LEKDSDCFSVTQLKGWNKEQNSRLLCTIPVLRLLSKTLGQWVQNGTENKMTYQKCLFMGQSSSLLFSDKGEAGYLSILQWT